MKVLIVSKALVVATYRRKLTELANLGVEVTAVVPPEWREGGDSVAVEPADDCGFELIVAPMRWNGHFHLHYYPTLKGIIRKIRPDLLHMDEEPYNLATYLGMRAAQAHEIACVFYSWQNIHGHYPPPFSIMERRVFDWTDHALVGSWAGAEVLRSKGFKKPITNVPQFGVDAELFRPCASHARPFTIGFFNRLIPAKGPLLTLQAFSRLPKECRLLIVGDGPLRGRLEREIQRLGLDGRVSLRSRVPSASMPDLMRSVDVVVLPSVTTPRWKEQFGRVLIEAMSSQVTIVASESGEIPTVVGDAGLLVPENDVDALTGALLRLHGDSELRAALGARGRERVLGQFTHNQVARQTLAVYRAALNSERNPSWTAP